jgi:quinol monooxygenase YgiN
LSRAPIVIVANLWACEETIDQVVELMREDAAYTHEQEPSCLLFSLHRDTDDPLHLTVIEAYADQAGLEAHRASAFYQRVMTELPDLLAGRDRTVLEPIATGDSDRAYVA